MDDHRLWKHIQTEKQAEDGDVDRKVQNTHPAILMNMSDNSKESRYGVSHMESRRVSEVPGLTHEGPPPATGGNSVSSRGARRGEQSLQATGQPKEQKILNILHWNCEGLYNKKRELATLMQSQNIDIACLQETHLNPNMRCTIKGFQCFRKDRENRPKGGVAIFVKLNIPASEIQTNYEEEIIGISLHLPGRKITIYNCYYPPTKPMNLHVLNIPQSDCIIVGDFNSHSPSWGYPSLDSRGEEVEDWQSLNNLQLINKPDDPPTFYSRAWHSTSTPDLAFATNEEYKGIKRSVLKQLSTSDHKPVMLTLLNVSSASLNNTIPRWNYKKAKWDSFERLTNTYTANINSKTNRTNKSAKAFTAAILRAAKESIPRGARKDYIPNWSEELQKLQEEAIKAREEAEQDKSERKNIQLKKTTAKYRQAANSAIRKSWHEKTESLNYEKDGTKLWRLIKSLNGDLDGRGTKVVLEENGEVKTDKAAANRFIEQYKSVGDIEIPHERKEEVKQEIEETRYNLPEEPHEAMTKPLTMEEMRNAMSVLKTKQSPGPDKITNDMISHLGSQAQKKLLQIFNSSWTNGKIPNEWRKAILIPIHKTGKPKNKAESYRPISLTSCLCKLMERMVNARLMWYLETENVIMEEQGGFRENRSTEDQIINLVQRIEDAFQDGHHAIAVWIDMEKAFDKVWTEGLILKLLKNKIQGKMLNWIEAYLQNRKACVRLQGSRSKTEEIKNGVPQGGVLSPTLFLIFINDIKETITRKVTHTMYADDLALICAEKEPGTAKVRLQGTLKNIESWSKQWGLKINKKKTTYTTFSLSRKTPTIKLDMDGHTLELNNNPTYLGVTFDPRLTWQKHTEIIQSKGMRRTSLIKKLAGTTWGAHHNILKKTYSGYVRPVLEYGIAAWGTAARSHQQRVNQVQNQNLRVMTGGMKSTPITEMETISKLASLEDRRDQRTLTLHEKFKRLSKHPMHTRMGKPVRSRIGRKSFMHQAKELSRDLNLLDTTDPAPVNTIKAPPWKSTTQPIIVDKIEGLDKKTELPSDILGHKVINLLDQKYPNDKWIRVYTDGSASAKARDGGGGIHIEWPDGRRESKAMPTGPICSNYKAETAALEEAARMLVNDPEISKYKAVLLTDAKSVLQALQSNKNSKLDKLHRILQDLTSANQATVLQWVPGHCNITGNETADRLAKQGSKLPQLENEIDLSEAKMIIRTTINNRWHTKHPKHQPSDPYHHLTRKDQITIFRLRTGHNFLKKHMFNKFKLGGTASCSCAQEEEDAEHILQRCPRYADLRETHWPTTTDIRQKLYGTMIDLEKTLMFVAATGLRI